MQQQSPRLVAIINPEAGSSDGSAREDLEQALAERNIQYRIIEATPSDGAGDLAKRALDEGAEHLVACGGDGTVMAVLNAMAGADALMSIVPLGTANMLASALGIPASIEEALDVALDGDDLIMDLGVCSDVRFGLGLGIGLTESIISKVNPEQKKKLGRLAYALAMLREIPRRRYRFTFTLDEEQRHAAKGVAVVIANTGQIWGNLKFAPDAEPDDGLLDLCIVHSIRLKHVLRMLWNLFRGNLGGDRELTFHQAAQIEIDSDPPLDIQIDGEETDMRTPLTVTVEPGAVRIRVPADRG